VFRDRGVTRALVDQAVEAGFDAIVLTADAPRLGRRERDLRTGFLVPEDIVVPSVAAVEGRWAAATPLELLRDEIALALALVGCASPEAVTPAYVTAVRS